MGQVSSERPLVASRRHTLTLCLVLLGIAAAGFAQTVLFRASDGGVSGPGALVYLPLLAAEWGLFAYVAMGVRRSGASLKDLISPRWTWNSLALDVTIGLALLGLWIGVEMAWRLAPWSGDHATATLARQALEVKGAADIPLWITLSVSAGFVEELTFRGYLQRQLTVMTGNTPAALVLQALLFGVSHGYQGAEPVIRITVFGLLFGLVAMVRKSTRPGMIAHALVDIVGGLTH
jgi:uncharacterized protein